MLLIESSHFSGGSHSRLITVCDSFKLTAAVFWNITLLTENNKQALAHVFTKRYLSYSTNWLWDGGYPYCKLSFSFSLSPTKHTHTVQCSANTQRHTVLALLDRNKWRSQELRLVLALELHNRADSSDHSWESKSCSGIALQFSGAQITWSWTDPEHWSFGIGLGTCEGACWMSLRDINILASCRSSPADCLTWLVSTQVLDYPTPSPPDTGIDVSEGKVLSQVSRWSPLPWVRAL